MDFFAGIKKPVMKSVLLLFTVLFSACSGKPFTVKTISGGKSGERNFAVAADLSEIINRNTESTRIKLTLDVTEDKFSAVQAMLEDKIDFVILVLGIDYDKIDFILKQSLNCGKFIFSHIKSQFDAG